MKKLSIITAIMLAIVGHGAMKYDGTVTMETGVTNKTIPIVFGQAVGVDAYKLLSVEAVGAGLASTGTVSFAVVSLDNSVPIATSGTLNTNRFQAFPRTGVSTNLEHVVKTMAVTVKQTASTKPTVFRYSIILD